VQTSTARHEGRTIGFLSVDGRLAGAIAIGDALKASTPDALKQLKNEGLRLVMLTSDNEATARRRETSTDR
jgi:Cu+-exporting ATPase